MQKGIEVHVDSNVEWPTTNAPCSRWFTTGTGFFSTEEGSKGYHWIELRNYEGAVIDDIVSSEDLKRLNMQSLDVYYAKINFLSEVSEVFLDIEKEMFK
tara:strand:- start:361 stop:657 length:297 start_codon:yes stop_codon:yes gene_type:complete